MTQLCIAVDARWDTELSFQPLLPDETVSSWVARHPHIDLRTDDHQGGERDFGTLTLKLPGAERSLRDALRRAAAPPDAWLLRPLQRTLYCARCQAEDWSLGVPRYERRAWCVAWCTCCPRHGQLFEADRVTVPTWPSLLLLPYWGGDVVVLVHKRPFHVVLALDLHSDRRAIHLEAALGEGKRRAAWFPQGLTEGSLRELYQAIVTDLMAQFDFDREGSPEERPNPGFNRQLNPTRFSVNVLAEAILSDWTQTPLPDNASQRRTHLLVRAIGWGAGQPTHIRAGQVLFRGAVERGFDLIRYESLLPSHLFGQLSSATQKPHRGCFTLAEARYLGLCVDGALQWLGKLTQGGQFLAFDARGGRLVRNPQLLEELRLQPDTASGVILPDWAYGPPPPPKALLAEDLDFFDPHSPTREMRNKARRRRQHQLLRTNVRFKP